MLEENEKFLEIFLNETQLKIKFFWPSFVNFLVHLYDRNIQKAITKERDPIYIENCSF